MEFLFIVHVKDNIIEHFPKAKFLLRDPIDKWIKLCIEFFNVLMPNNLMAKTVPLCDTIGVHERGLVSNADNPFVQENEL